MSDYRSLNKEEVATLMERLRGNAYYGNALHMGRDTSFLTEEDEKASKEAINAIQSVPTHY